MKKINVNEYRKKEVKKTKVWQIVALSLVCTLFLGASAPQIFDIINVKSYIAADAMYNYTSGNGVYIGDVATTVYINNGEVDGVDVALLSAQSDANAVLIALKAYDSEVVHNTGNENIAGIKTFTDTTEATAVGTASTVLDGGLSVARKVIIGKNGDSASLTFEDYTTPASATPANINMGDSYAATNTADQAKLKLRETVGGAVMGIGTTSAAQNYFVFAGAYHDFYISTGLTTRMEPDGTLSVATANYEALVIGDDDIPNAKWVKDSTYAFTNKSFTDGTTINSGQSDSDTTINGDDVNTKYVLDAGLGTHTFVAAEDFLANATDDIRLIAADDLFLEAVGDMTLNVTTGNLYLGGDGAYDVVLQPGGSTKMTLDNSGRLSAVAGYTALIDADTVMVNKEYVDDQMPDNIVTVNSIADLPTPSDLSDGLGEAYRLNDGRYKFGTSMSLAYPIAPTASAGNVFLDGGNFTTITYTGSGAFIRANTTNYWPVFTTMDIAFAGDSTNTMYDVEGNGSQLTSNFFVAFADFEDMGTIKSQAIAQFQRCSFSDCETLILDSNNINFLFSMAVSSTAPFGGAYFRIQGTSFSTEFQSFEGIPQSGDSVFDVDSGYLGLMSIAGVNVVTAYGGTAFKAGSLNQTEPSFISRHNRGIPDSIVSAQVNIGANALETSIPLADAKVLINSDQWDDSELERVTVDSSGIGTYTGLEADKLAIHFSLTLAPASGVNQSLGIRMCKFLSTEYTVTFTNGTNVINETSTALADGDNISFYDNTGTLPAELREDIVYYVVNKATNSFQISYTLGGAVVAFTDDGSGTIEYKTTILNGISAGAKISSTETKSLTRFGIMELSTDDKFGIVGWNSSTSNNISATSGGYILE